MALDISGASIGYDASGIGTALDNIHTKVIEETINQMKNSKDTFTDWLHTAWVGHSADNFENNFFVQEARIAIALQKAEAALRTQFGQIVTELAHADAELVEKDSLSLSDF